MLEVMRFPDTERGRRDAAGLLHDLRDGGCKSARLVKGVEYRSGRKGVMVVLEKHDDKEFNRARGVLSS